MRRATKAAVGLALLVGSVGSVAAYLDTTTMASPAEIVRVTPGCPGLPPATTTAPSDQVAVVVPRDTAPTAVDHIDGALDPRGVFTDARRLLGGFAVISSVTLPSSGIELEIRSDGPISVDEAELDALARLPLERHATFADARVAALMRCYEERVVVERELAGTKLRVYVPSDHAACFRRGRLSRVGNEAYAATCDAAGFTLPGLPLRLKLMGVEVANLSNEATIVVSGAAVDVERAEQRLSYHLLHEFVHHYDNSLGLPPWNGPLSHYERRAYYVERSLRTDLAEGSGPPIAVRYPAPDARP